MDQGLKALIATSHASAHARKQAHTTGAVPTSFDEALDVAEKKLVEKIKPWIIAGMITTALGVTLTAILIKTSDD
jgi:hypothetical protein